MLSVRGVVAFSLLVTVWAEDSDVTKAMRQLKVIPDVIDEGPKDLLKISHDSGVSVDKGAELRPSQVKNRPKVEWNADDPTVYYTLIMTDPDAPAMGEWQHWLVGNIPGSDLSRGQELSEYVGAGAPRGTGLHRYVFLLYKQPAKLQFDEKHLINSSAEGRAYFSTKKFAQKYNLGLPVAGNFYRAQWDDYVPELHKQLGF